MSESTPQIICDGCNVRPPHEHKCHGDECQVKGVSVGLACECPLCVNQAKYARGPLGMEAGSLKAALETLGATTAVAENANRRADQAVFYAANGELHLHIVEAGQGGCGSWKIGTAQGEWHLAVPCGRLIRALENIPDGDARFSQVEGHPGLLIESGEIRMLVRAVSAEMDRENKLRPEVCMPDLLPPRESTPTLTINLDDLCGLASAVEWGVAPAQTRYSLNGMLLEARKGNQGIEVTAVGSDGKRLTMASVGGHASMINPEGWEAHTILPGDTVAFLQRLLRCPLAEEQVHLQLRDGKVGGARMVEITCGPFRYRSVLVQGLYPAFRQVLPDRKPEKGWRQTHVRLRDFSEMVHRSAHFYADCDCGHVGIFAITDTTIRCTVSIPDVVSSAEEVPCQHPDPLPEPRRIGLDLGLLVEALDYLEMQTDQLAFHTRDSDSALVIEARLANDLEFYYLQMPTDIEDGDQLDPWLRSLIPDETPTPTPS